ncbi:hypothetical protein BBW65_03480 [Helicobacter enhydrae]|uniref:Uncharacterized protein n=1 Tax=Helicobacter enhydrae TaxID=222136 RepID=A0A1B1U547_9HELI|nr:hypothetical protein BBW65_03480 [Helicobacter enhydrae]
MERAFGGAFGVKCPLECSYREILCCFHLDSLESSSTLWGRESDSYKFSNLNKHLLLQSVLEFSIFICQFGNLR